MWIVTLVLGCGRPYNLFLCRTSWINFQRPLPERGLGFWVDLSHEICNQGSQLSIHHLARADSFINVQKRHCLNTDSETEL